MSILKEIRALAPTTKDLRQFGWLVGGIFCAIGAFAWYRDTSWFEIPLWIGAPLVVLGTILPAVLKPVYFGWMSFAVVLGHFMTRVILTIFFFVVLTPVGLFFKLIGRDSLTRKIDKDAETYWIDKEYPIEDRSRLENFF